MRFHRTRIKICGITRPQDARDAAAAGADAIGLVFWSGTPRRVEIERARAIVAALPPFVSVVGLFVDPVAEEVRRVLAALPIGLLQFHGRESAAFCRGFGVPYVKAVAVAAGASRDDLLEYAARYDDAAGWLFDAPARGGLPGGTGHTFDWSTLPREPARPLVLSGGLHAGNVAEAIRAVEPWGVDVSSGVEARDPAGNPLRGIKDAERMKAFVREVRHAND